MKLSLAWIFDHIDADYKQLDVALLVERLNETTAEIEGWHSIDLDIASLTLARTVDVDGTGVDVHIPEYNSDIRLDYREGVRAGHYCFLRVVDGAYTWARMSDFGSSKETLLPLVYADTLLNAHTWRSMIQTQDIILEVDNKSITHRPDLWSHRGFAREIAALLKVDLKPLEDFLAPLEVQSFTGSASPVSSTAPVITIQDQDACSRLASSLIETVSWSPSRIPILVRLCSIDSKPIDALIDNTNYVMFDIGQPMHAFDAQKVRDHELIVRRARVGESLKLLDDQIIELTSHDVILADSRQPLSLVGIMGGTDSGVTTETRSLLLESGCFNASAIRQAATRHKKRTDASMRFEKSLDPEQAVYAIRRFIQLLNDAGISYTSEGYVIVVGAPTQVLHINLNHAYIETKLGISLESEFVIQTLESLSFDVMYAETGGGIQYKITVPTWRATKDVTIKEDIVEEIARFFGYKNIQSYPLQAERKPVDVRILYRQRRIKRFLSMSAQMRELSSYAFFDESWLREIEWQPTHTLEALQPVSTNWRRLVTTLTPTHLKAIADNLEHHRKMRFFEWARIWCKEYNEIESPTLSGIFFDQDGQEDFYDYKAILDALFKECSMPVTWQRIDGICPPWFLMHQTAHIMCDGVIVGTMGMLKEEWRAKVAPSGVICAFELNAAFIQNYSSPITTYQPVSRFPDSHRDVSVLVPLAVTADMLHTAIAQSHDQIIVVQLVDFFQREEWGNKKSLTFNYVIRDMHKTMTTQEVDAISEQVNRAVRACGAEIR